MRISAILDQKSSNAVEWIRPEEKVTDALIALSNKGIGTLIVSNDGKRANGILSESDIVRTLADKGKTALVMRVDALMTPDPVCCELDQDSSSVLQKMTSGRFRHVPVLSADGTLAGVVSIGDIVKSQLSDLEQEREALVDMIAGR